jgi:ATP-dependent helicase HrpA
MYRVQTVAQRYQQLRRQSGNNGAGETQELQRIRWMIEELRVSYFAQELRTPYPVSDKRIYQAMDELARP